MTIDDLVFKIGGMDIDKEGFTFRDEETHAYDAGHKFVVAKGEQPNEVLIYVAKARGHKGVVEQYGLDPEKVIGGGSIYVNDLGQLALNNFSADYGGAISKAAQTKFAQLLIPELKKQGIAVNNLAENEMELRVHRYWNNLD